jgi:hypothetical protein
MAEQLNRAEQAALVERLQSRLSGRVTREALLAEFERRKEARVFQDAESLYGKYAEPSVDLSAEELEASIREFSTEWEKELDDDADNH